MPNNANSIDKKGSRSWVNR